MVLTSIYKRKGRRGVTLEFQDPQSGDLRQKAFPTRADAIAYRDSVREAWNVQPDVHARGDVPFEEYSHRWLRATKTAVRAGTYRIYESAVRVHLVPFFKGSLRGITRAGVRDLITQLREGGMKRKSIANIRGTLHGILQAAVEEERIKANPAHTISRSNLMRLTATGGERRASIKAFDLTQAPKFFTAAAETAPLHSMLWRTMVATGLRPGEAAALRPEDLDYNALRIRLERAVTRGVVGPCKTQAPGEVDIVGMPAGLADELRAWEAQMAREALAAGRPRSEWLFPSSTGGLLDEKGAAECLQAHPEARGTPGAFLAALPAPHVRDARAQGGDTHPGRRVAASPPRHPDDLHRLRVTPASPRPSVAGSALRAPPGRSEKVRTITQEGR